MGKPTKLRVEQRNLDSLTEHSRQAELFGDVPDEPFDELVDSLRREGQRQPIEILPDGVIVAGHQRVRAARRLGWSTIQAVVRHDLAAAGPAAVEQHLIRENLERRHMSRLDLARAYKRLKELERGRTANRLLPMQQDELRDRVGKKLGLSGRSLDRYLRILDTPRAVQDAFERGELPLITAGRVAGLSRKQQAEIAARIEAGEQPRAATLEYLPAGSAKHQRPVQALEAFAKSLRRGLDDLDGRLDKISARAVLQHRQVLQQTLAAITQLLEVANAD